MPRTSRPPRPDMFTRRLRSGYPSRRLESEKTALEHLKFSERYEGYMSFSSILCDVTDAPTAFATQLHFPASRRGCLAYRLPYIFRPGAWRKGALEGCRLEA